MNEVVEIVLLRYGLGIIGDLVTKDQAREASAKIMQEGKLTVPSSDGKSSSSYAVHGIRLVDDEGTLKGVGSLIAWVERPSWAAGHK